MIYRIEFTKSARKEFEKIPTRIRQKTIDALTLISQNPHSELLQIKKLKSDADLYRCRLGDYRLVYEIKNATLVVLVIKIGHRKEVYRRL